MKTRMSENSLIANEQVDKLTGKEKVMLCFKQSQYLTAKEISRLSGLALGTTTARINQLRYDYGKLIQYGSTDTNETIYTINTSGVIDQRPLSNAQQMLKELEELSNGTLFISNRGLRKFISKWKKIVD